MIILSFAVDTFTFAYGAVAKGTTRFVQRVENSYQSGGGTATTTAKIARGTRTRSTVCDYPHLRVPNICNIGYANLLAEIP